MLLIDTYRDRALEEALPLLHYLHARGDRPGTIPQYLFGAIRPATRRGWVAWRGQRLRLTEDGERARGEGGEDV